MMNHPTAPHIAPLKPRAAGWFSVAALVLLAGCGTMSEDACRVADWQRIGREDGARGEPQSRLGDHAETCKKAGVTPDPGAWQRGWDTGVRSYCTPQVGWREGLEGKAYQGVCRGRGEEAFLANYQPASEIKRTQDRINAANSETKRLEGQLANAKTDDERKGLRERLRRNDVELVRLRATLAALQSAGPRY